MSAVSQTIPNLLGGVSQQPDPIKLPGQVKEAINAYLDPTFGCKKRPPSEFVALLDSTIPSDAKWFPVFRDEAEKYIVCIYKAGSPATIQVKVWDAKTGAPRAVTVDASAQSYLDTTDVSSLETLSLADYTLISNSQRVVSMSQVSLTGVNKEALISINTVSYNTTYSIDLNRDGNTQQTQVYKATELEITPGSYETPDGGLCTQHSAGDHTVNHPTDNTKTGLGFRVVNQCAAYFEESSNSYISRYTASVILKNGGVGWRVGDEVTVTEGGKSFTIRVSKEAFEYTYASDGTATYTTPSNASSGTLQVSDIITNLKTAVTNITGYTADSIGNVLRVKRTDSRDFNIAVRGGVTNSAMTVIKGTAADITELPYQCFPDFECKVKNTQDSTADDYYVKFVPDAAGIPGAGSWEESPKPGIDVALNSSTMPHALIRQADGTFKLEALNSSSAFGGWASRDCGDENSNPNPSFVGQGISNMFFFQNRLGFLSEDALIMSQAGDYFNFFVSSAIAVSDADPIDINAASEKPATLRDAIGTPKGLILFAENSQFLLSSEDVAFGPATVKLKEISTYTYKSNTQPLSTGVSIMFATESETYSKVFEMAVDSVDNRPTVADNTRIIPEYIPTNLKWATNSPNNSFLMWGDNTETIYNFKFYNTGNERQLAGWGKWTFPTSVRMFEYDNDTAYVVCFDGTKSILLKMELMDDPANAPITTTFNTKFLPRLDFIQYKSDLVIDTTNNISKVYFPQGSYVGTAIPVLYVSSGSNASTFVRPEIKTATAAPVESVTKVSSSVTYNQTTGATTATTTSGSGTGLTVKLSQVGNALTAVEVVNRGKGYAVGDDIFVPTNVLQGGSSTTAVKVADVADIQQKYIEVEKFLTDDNFLIGLQYRMTVSLPSFYVTVNGKADRLDVPVVETLHLDLYYSGRYQVELERLGYPDNYVEDIDITKAGTYKANSAALIEVFSKTVPIYCLGKDATASIYADDPVPAAVTSYSWQGHYNKRSIVNLKT